MMDSLHEKRARFGASFLLPQCADLFYEGIRSTGEDVHARYCIRKRCSMIREVTLRSFRKFLKSFPSLRATLLFFVAKQSYELVLRLLRAGEHALAMAEI